jgi:hypothetical protein
VSKNLSKKLYNFDAHLSKVSFCVYMRLLCSNFDVVNGCSVKGCPIFQNLGGLLNV